MSILRVVLAIERVHLVQRILYLFILLPADAGRVLASALVGAASQFQVEVDARAELVDVDRVFGRLVDISRGSHKAVVARAGAHRGTHGCAQWLVLRARREALATASRVANGRGSHGARHLWLRVIQLMSNVRMRAERARRRLWVYVAGRLGGSRQLVHIYSVCLFLTSALSGWRRRLLIAVVVPLAHELLVLLRQHAAILVLL